MVARRDPERFHRLGEFARRRHHVRQRIVVVLDAVDVEEHRARDMRRLVFGGRLAAHMRQMVGRIGDHEAGRSKTARKPFGRDEGGNSIGHPRLLLRPRH
jgi:hypothetical protein